jgi:hypothetical protein
LLSNTVEYSIIKKPLETTLKGAEKDTVYIDSSLTDIDAIRAYLEQLLEYRGFATDTLSKESDDESVLTGAPAIAVEEIEDAPIIEARKILAKSNAAAKAYLVKINASSVSAKNYAVESKNLIVAYKSGQSVPILSNPQSLIPNPQTTRYFNLKGEPLGAQKPANSGVYIEKNGKSVRKVVVR